MSSELWTRADAAAADRHSMSTLGAPSAVLMERVAVAAASEILRRWPAHRTLDVYAGPGNNGADGVAVARVLAQRGWICRVMFATPEGNEARDHQRARATAVGVGFDAVSPPRDQAVVLDALLGTGAVGPLRSAIRDGVRIMRGHPRIVAIDVPTGVDPDEGTCDEDAVVAACTVTVERSKLGLHVTPGRACAGEVVVARVGIERPAAATTRSEGARLIDGSVLMGADGDDLWAAPRGAAHKGVRGHVGVWAGSAQTPGAAILAVTASLRGGAGLVSLHDGHGEVGPQVIAARPEVMLDDARTPLLSGAQALVVGPGLLSCDVAEVACLRSAWLEDPRPAVWDAAGLGYLAASVGLGSGPTPPSGPRVITPHPGEAAQLLAALTGETASAADVQAARVNTARRLARGLHAHVVLKGAGTLVASPGGALTVCTEGTSALATAGTGDVLAGLLGALLARQVSPSQAAAAAVLVHAEAGRRAAKKVGGADDDDEGGRAPFPAALELCPELAPAVASLANAAVASDRRLAGFPREVWA